MGERVGVGTYRCTVIDVTDLDVGYRFWSEVTGLEIIGRTPGGWHGRFGYLGHKDPWKHGGLKGSSQHLEFEGVRCDEAEVACC